MSRPSILGGLIRLCVVFGLIFVSIALIAPLLLNQPIKHAIEKHFDNTIVVGGAQLSILPPRLKLSDVHVKNPKNYPAGDMVVFGEIILNVDFTNTQTAIIKSVTYSEVSGYPSFVDNVDNFSVYQKYLETKNDQIPTGIWRWPVMVETYQVRNGWTGNQDPMVKLEDKNFDPIGSLQNPVSLQGSMLNGLDKVLTQQRKALPQLLLESTKEKLNKVMDSIGEKIKELTR